MFKTTARQLNLVAPPALPAAVFALAASARLAAAEPPPVPNRSELAKLWDAEMKELASMAPPPAHHHIRNPGGSS